MATASSKSSSNILRHNLPVLAIACLLSLGLYLLVSRLYLRTGFPLDDAWIHLTYARNLANYGEWAFVPGTPSAGSTSPLWSAVLAIGFLLHLAPYIWTYLLGFACLLSLAVYAEESARKLLPSYSWSFPFIGIFFAVEWHLVWAAGSGMETLLHALLVTGVLLLLAKPSPQPMTLGLLVALSVWVRPDGITLLGPAILTLFLGKNQFSSVLKFLIGFGVIFGLYLLFNLILSGNPFPNTFYAKQAEYITWQTNPLFSKVGLTLLQILTGPMIVLLAGVFIWLIRSIRLRDWGTLSGMIWFIGYFLIYAVRMPPYQHGRYLLPAMPVLFLWGLLGMVHHYQSPAKNPRTQLLKKSWIAIVIFVTLGFVGMGAKSYAQDVAYIETEMVDTANWAKKNLPSGALIAAHDIGALGYFDDHELIDLAGLVSPQVIPFLRDESQIADYLDQTGTDYFIAFPGLYPELAARAKEVFSTHGAIAPMLGGENLSIYQWTIP